MSSYIALIDPSKQKNNGSDSLNLGDLVIYDAVSEILNTIFPGVEIKRISAHQSMLKPEINMLNKAEHIFVGGTNILTSNIRHFDRFIPAQKKGFYLYPGFTNVILLGTGWNAYEPRPDWATIIYYQRTLSKKYIHAIRDNYSVSQLKKAFINKAIHTSCPSVWELSGDFENHFNNSYNQILFALTGYKKDVETDEELIRLLFETQQEIYFFPQGSEDLDYIQTLGIFKQNKSKFNMLNHDYAAFKEFVTGNDFNYTGTRLHCGITCIQHHHPAMIIGIDNRSLEMKKDINLPVLEKKELGLLAEWVRGKYAPGKINLPLDNIQKWKSQFTR